MKTKLLLMAGGLTSVSLILVALPGPAKSTQDQTPRAFALVQDHPVIAPTPEEGTFNVMFDGGASWLGIETQEVTADKTKELKLPAERGVLIGKILPDSPAAKAGLKENDVITEVNGQRVEGSVQFRRFIREIPAGRTVQLSVWRDGHSQTVAATLGKSEMGNKMFMRSTPGVFAFRTPEAGEMPEVPPMPEIAEIPPMNWDTMMAPNARPRLGIDAEDLSGQLGTFFGAPDGEGVLVRSVNSGSPAEKGGMKAGDVITSINGDRIRSVGDLREKLSAKESDKEQTVKVNVLRNKSQISLDVQLPAAPEAKLKMKLVIKQKTNI